MASDEPIGEVLTHVEDKVWRIWAVSLGLAFILGRLFFIQESHELALINLVESTQNLKTEIETLKIQTQTYQNSAREQASRILDRLDNL